MKKLKENRLFQHIYRNRFRYLIGIIFLIVVDYVGLFIPQYIGEVTDNLSTHTIDYAGVINIVIKMLICAAIMSLSRFAWRYFILGSSIRVINGVRKDIFAKLETLSQDYFNKNKTGDIMTYFTNDLDSIEDAIGFSVISAFDAIGLTIMTLYKMMTYVSFKLTFFTMIPMSLVAYFGLKLGKKFDDNFYQKQQAFGKLNDAVQEAVTAERVIKAFRQEDKQLELFNQISDDNRKVNVRISFLRSTFWPLLDVVIGFAYLVAIVLGGYYAICGDISLGRFITFSSYINTLVWPMLAIGDCITTVSQGTASIKRLNEVFHQKADIVDAENCISKDTLSGKIEFRNVNFQYEQDLLPALKDINVTINPGETFAIMGKTGCGKTTFVNLITRLYDVSSGELLIDDINIKDIKLKDLHENIAYVPQDNFLFSETLQENISFGKTDATEQEITQACKIADIHDNIMDFPMKYETMLGERGVTLSGGQKQRSSIARAIIKDSPILIMDDSLSAVDTDTEDNILRNLKVVRDNKTTIIVAHRVSTVQNADHILILEDGKIAEYGTYDSLIEQNGIFKRMVDKQQLEKQLLVDQEVK